MRVSQLYLATLKEAPAEAEIASHQLMVRAGLVRKLAAGIYTWLPLGMRILRKVKAIIREEMECIGAQECLLPTVQPKELWQTTGRWQSYGPELLRFQDRHQRDFCLGPTHEEVVTELIRREVKSYKQLPLILYQIHTKFRDEIRPRFGAIRSREFLMKDAYSFHDSKASLEATYEAMYQAYLAIFDRLGLAIKVVKADTGMIGGNTSHEFQVLSAVGEDEILYSEDSQDAMNRELAHLAPLSYINKMQSARSIEVGHIFQLGDRYSKPLQTRVSTREGALSYIQMGCYGIGVSRILAAAIEQDHENNGIKWPKAMAPFKFVIIPVHYSQSEVQRVADQLYESLKAQGLEVLLDDRDMRFGVAYSDMNLIGIPHRIIVSSKGLARDEIEYKRYNDTSQWFSHEALLNFLKQVA